MTNRDTPQDTIATPTHGLTIIPIGETAAYGGFAACDCGWRREVMPTADTRRDWRHALDGYQAHLPWTEA